MRIINGKRFYKKEIDAAVIIHANGWNSYNGRNHQWYYLKYNPDCGLVILDADNSGDCYGDYATRYFDSPTSFANWCKAHDRSWEKLLGEIDEENETAMQFAEALLASNQRCGV